MNNKYVKVVYQSSPIGKEKIILYLTTIDLDALEKDNKLIEKEEFIVNEFSKNELEYAEYLEQNLSTMVKNFYEERIKKIEEIIRKKEYQVEAKDIKEAIKNVTNVDEVHCKTIYGNVVNCDKVYCEQIKGNVVNSNIVMK